eukprot:m.386591 g.386591  ORF g.386591 m.386591 type:complete len:466 (+) comp21018_c1_seq3:679-2076(+)
MNRWQNLSTRFADYKANSDCIFVGDLRNVVDFDEQALTVTVEPLIDVGTITRWLTARGYMLATTLEIEEATIGGLAMAVGMTTASHKYGLLQETVMTYEVILGDGQRVFVEREGEYADLYHALPWSHGSLALLVGITLKVVPIKKYVRVVYRPMKNTDTHTYCEVIRDVSLAGSDVVADFVEATIFSRKSCVVMTGSFVDAPTEHDATINHVGRWHKPWFYTHVRAMLNRDTDIVEYVPTLEYIFRHNRGIFWTLRDQLPEAIGNHPVFRWTLGWMTPPQVTFLKLPATKNIRWEMMNERVYQDIVLPLHTLETAISRAADLFGIWPLLVYPSRIYNHGKHAQGLFREPHPDSVVPGTNYGMYYDLGVYGIPREVRRKEPYDNVSTMRMMEEYTRCVGGAPFLYADTFMDRTEFSEMFDLRLYEHVRTKYGAALHFPHVYDKTSGCQSFDWRNKANTAPALKKST